jgi:hypothetical protein
MTMPYVDWFLWHADYIEDFKWRLHFQFKVALWRAISREVYIWRAKSRLKGIENFNLEHRSSPVTMKVVGDLEECFMGPVWEMGGGGRPNRGTSGTRMRWLRTLNPRERPACQHGRPLFARPKNIPSLSSPYQTRVPYKHTNIPRSSSSSIIAMCMIGFRPTIYFVHVELDLKASWYVELSCISRYSIHSMGREGERRERERENYCIQVYLSSI